jgi:hypothetical protein
MRCIGMLFRAEWRRRWASWVALAFLISLIGGTVLAGVSAAGRTSSAFPRYVDRYGFDADVFGAAAFPKDFVHLPHVESVAESTYYFNGNAVARGHFVPQSDLAVVGLPTSHLDSAVKLLSGRLPVGPREVLVGYSMQQQFGLRIGSVVSVPFYTPAQLPQILASNAAPTLHGPTFHFRVVGVEASQLDFPTTTPSYSLYLSNTFARTQGLRVASGYFAEVRLTGGERDMPQFQFRINNLGVHHEYFVTDEDTSTAAIEGSIHPQVIGWWLFSLFAAIAGVALIGQALSRQNLVEKESYPTLAALGVRPNQLFGLGMIRAGVVGAMGGVGALILTIAVSPFTPVGEARAAELTRGFVLDAPTLGLGLLSIVLVVLVLAAIPSWRAAQVQVERNRQDQAMTRRDSNVARLMATLGSPPSVLIGVRNALERGRGRSSVPVTTALVGTVLAVAALVASTIFGASLSNLVNTPHLYGANWQVNLENVPTAKVSTIVATYRRDSSVTKITYGGEGKDIDINGVPVQSIYVHVVKGPMVYSLISGRYPTGVGQLDLGQTSMAQTHTHVGSRVTVSIVNLKGATRTSKVNVVGTVAIPPSVGIGGLGDGAVLLVSGLERMACTSGPSAQPCIAALQKKFASLNSWNVAVAVRAGPAGQATITRLQRMFASYYQVQTLPTDLVNFGQAVDFPLLLGVTLALFGAATLAHLLFVSVTRRRRQFALLKVLGFVRRQVSTAMCWQATTIAVIGVVFGVPTGLIVGKIVWKHFAVSLGAVPFAVVPLSTIVLLVAVIIVGGNVLALIPATLAARISPAEALREA